MSSVGSSPASGQNVDSKGLWRPARLRLVVECSRRSLDGNFPGLTPCSSYALVKRMKASGSSLRHLFSGAIQLHVSQSRECQEWRSLDNSRNNSTGQTLSMLMSGLGSVSLITHDLKKVLDEKRDNVMSPKFSVWISYLIPPHWFLPRRNPLVHVKVNFACLMLRAGLRP
jgi:hypothetical protein